MWNGIALIVLSLLIGWAIYWRVNRLKHATVRQLGRITVVGLTALWCVYLIVNLVVTYRR